VAIRASLVESDRSVVLIQSMLNCLSTSSQSSAGGVNREELAQHQRRVQSLIVTASTRISSLTDLDQKILALYAQSIEAANPDSNLGDVDDQLIKSVEQCEICDAAIAFKSMDVARCQSGHQFSKTQSRVPMKPANAIRSL